MIGFTESTAKCEGDAVIKFGPTNSSWLPPLLLTALTCWLLAPMPVAAIVGGAQLADPAVARHVVLISGPGSMCSGVLIAADLVLTAAHCVDSRQDYAIHAPSGQNYKKTTAIQVILHHSYSTGITPQRGADLALLKFHPSKDMDPIPATLSNKDAVWIAERFVVIGFGRSASGATEPSPTPRTATLRIRGLPSAQKLTLVDPATRAVSG